MTEKHFEKPSASFGSAPKEAGGFLAPFGVKVDPALLERALTHRSWAAENKGRDHNERLEFLGDSVLGFAVTTYLYKRYSKLSESELTRRRAAVVSTVALAQAARRINLGAYLYLSRGENDSGGRDKDSILADALEAVIGAVFLSTGIDTAKTFVLELLEPQLADIDFLAATIDPKSALQEIAAARALPLPQYLVTGTGPDHDRRYTATVELLGVVGIGRGTSKKAAEAAAARQAVLKLHEAELHRVNADA